MIEEELRDLGFRDNEVKVYIALLRMGRGKAGRIAKECSLERTSTYNAIKKLQEKGLVSYVFEASRKVFSVAEPIKILDMLKEKEERANLVIPKLEQLKKAEQEKENILKFRGYNGVKTVLNDILKTCKDGETHYIIGSEGQLTKRMPTFARIFVVRKDKKKLHARVLLRKGRHSDIRSKYAKIRFLPQETVSKSVTNIYGEKVAIILWSEIPEAIVIDDKSTAETYKAYFEFMWKNAGAT
ncbi:MAG: helix-turn-helix domain-containing protein [Nanoarchaeota archaeon]